MAAGKSYTINISHLMQNADRTFFLFQEVPNVVNNPSGEIFANIFQTAPSVTGAADGSSNLSFTITNEFFAIYGTKKGDQKAMVETSSYKQVALGPNGSVVAMTTVKGEGKDPKWDEAKFATDFSGDGGFKFMSDGTFDNSNPSKFRLRRRDPLMGHGRLLM